jgi:Domain of unknown function (DUF6378)
LDNPKHPNFGKARDENLAFLEAQAAKLSGAPVKMGRVAILETAANLTTGPRADTYGDFGEQMRSLSRAFNGITGKDITPKDVTILLILLKLRRAETGGDQDSAVDGAAYFALLGEFFL